MLAQVEIAERAGLELIGIQDHPYQRRFLDTFSLIAGLMARTERLRFFPAVANLPLRPPAMLAKVAATLDFMSDGRFELGIGAGGFPDAVAAMGGPRREPGEAVEALEEAIGILRAAWDEGSVRHKGSHYVVNGFRAGPPPPHRIGIWVGAYKPRMLRLTGRLADGWFPSMAYAPPDQAREMHARIDDAAAAAGRDPREIRRIYNVSGTIADPAEWADRLTELAAEYRFDDFVFSGDDGDPVEQTQRFAHEVVPRVREALAQH